MIVLLLIEAQKSENCETNIIFYVDINFVIELHLTIVGIAIFLGHGIGVALNARV